MQPKISLIVSGNLYMRQMRFDKGDIEKGHSHTYDHLTLLTSGSLKVSVDNIETVFEAPTAIKILAGRIHKLEALEDGTLAYCVHALRESTSEDVLPPQTQFTDEETKVFKRTENGLLIKPTPAVAKVDGVEIDLAPIAFISNSDINGDNFNRNQDDVPLVVITPEGTPEGKTFV